MKLEDDDAYGRRLKIADDCLNDMIEWLQHGGGQVGIYDGNNITEDRRKEIHDKLVANDIHVRSKYRNDVLLHCIHAPLFHFWVRFSLLNPFVINLKLSLQIFEALKSLRQT